MINKEDVASVYSGKNGFCCCGCSGRHYYSSSVKDRGLELRGYEIQKNEVNDRMISRVVNLMNKKFNELENESSYYGLVSDDGKRIYLAYIKPGIR